MGQRTLASLPLEIVEKILLDVPTYDLTCNEPWICKTLTNVVLEPRFWTLKMKKLNIDFCENIWALLQEFEKKIIVNCLFSACIYEEHVTLHTPLKDSKVHIPTDKELRTLWVITDDDMIMATGILLCRSPLFVEIRLHKETTKGLTLLLKLLKAKANKILVHDDYGFWNFSPRYDFMKIIGKSDNYILSKFRGCVPSLEGYETDFGHWSCMKKFPDLTLSIGVNDQNIAVNPGFSTNLGLIEVIHIKAGTDVSELSPLDYSFMIVSGLQPFHIDWMIETYKTLSHRRGLGILCNLIFLSFTLGKQSSRKLIRNLIEAGFNCAFLNNDMCNIMCSSTTLNKKDEKALRDLNKGRFKLFKSDDKIIEFIGEEYGIQLKSKIRPYVGYSGLR